MAFRPGRGVRLRRGTADPVRRNSALFFIGVVIVAFMIVASLMVFAGQSTPAGSGTPRAEATAGRTGIGPAPAGARQAPAGVGHSGRPEYAGHRPTPFDPKVPVHQPTAPRRHAHAQAAGRVYTVRRGDCLYSIAQRLNLQPPGWIRLYLANRSTISHPDLIYPGQVLHIPGPAAATGVRHDGGDGQSRTAAVVHPGHGRATRKGPAPGGTLGCASLAALWERAGGSPSAATTAASIAMAESSGEQYATGPAGERGYWQIHPDHGSLSTYDPYGNARAAVILSADGTNWSPWTTYTSGAYAGRCGPGAQHAAAERATAASTTTTGYRAAAHAGSERARVAVGWALRQIGAPYLWGGTGNGGFDCSGLVMSAWAAAGVRLPRTSYEQADAGPRITREQLRPGDLVLSNGFGHVAMYIGGGQVVQASTPGSTVSVSPLPPDGWVNAYVHVAALVG